MLHENLMLNKKDVITRRMIMDVVSNILMIFNIHSHKMLAQSAKALSMKLYSWVHSEGPQGLSRWKDLSNYMVRRTLLSNSPTQRPSCKIPKSAWALMRLGHKSKLNTRVVLSVFNLHRMVKMEPDISVDTLTARFTGSWLLFI